MRCASILMSLMFFSSSALSQANNPFEFQPEEEAESAPEVIQPVQSFGMNQPAEELSRTQREEVLFLLAEALEKAAIAGGQGIYQIEGFKRFFVMDDDDLFLGMMNNKFIVKDVSRNKLEYIDSEGYMGVVTKTEWTTSIRTIVNDLTEIERKTLGTEAFVDDEEAVIENAQNDVKQKISIGENQPLSN